jgi:alpha/beta superfamily hydrolase
MRVVPTHIETDDGVRLQAAVRTPDERPRGSAVICHAHPQHGGLMDHRLLAAIRRELVDAGFAVVSFNFRGVMGSQGRFGGGTDEELDVRAALRRARTEAPGPTLLCGWSFGARVALRVAVEEERVAALALVAMSARDPADSDIVVPDLPPVEARRRWNWPVLALVGGSDPYCPVREVERLVQTLPGGSLQVMANADHYFAGREREAALAIVDFVRRALFDESDAGRQDRPRS